MARTGHLVCPKELQVACCAVADDSFTTTYPFTLNNLPPAPKGWKYHLETATMIRLRGYCDPHTDPNVANWGEPGQKEPEHRTVFWLLKDTSKRKSYLMAENRSFPMVVNDWVFFNSSRLHAFLADGVWIGVSVQLTRDVSKPKRS